MKKDPLLQPYKLKHLTLRNRIMTTSHEPAYPEDGLPKDRYRLYHLERAKAGIALTMTAGSAAVSRDSPPAFNNILCWKDEVVPWMKKLADDCHEAGAAVMIQLTHLGRRTRWDNGDWLPVVAPGPFREPAHRAFPKVIEEWDINRIVKDYADAAERMKEANLDGVEFECYGHLLDQFMSPLTNALKSTYGGSLENRMRFSMEVLGACRDRVGDNFLLGMRYTADEGAKGGITVEEGVEIARRFKKSGLVDFVNIIRGQVHTDAALTRVIPLQGMRSAPHLDLASRIRSEVGLPTFHGARISDVATARYAISSGQLDMVGMTRAHIADPHIVKKIREGREHDIRPCVGATYCLDRIYQGTPALCIHNPSTGREKELPHNIEPSKDIRRFVIVGAGPAGLEAARVAGERGHKVTVFEAADQPGGQVRLTAQSPRKAEMISIIDWRMDQCSGLDVEFKFNTFAEEKDIAALDPEVVIIATGGLPRTDVLETGQELVVSAWDILTGDAKPGNRVLLFDDAGDHVAMQASEKLAESGSILEIMTPDRSFAPEVMGLNLAPYMRSLQGEKVTFTVTYRLKSVKSLGNALRATIGSDYKEIELDREVDQVVVNHGTTPLDDLYFELKPKSSNLGSVNYDALINCEPQMESRGTGNFQLFRIGDAVESRNTHAAIFDANRLLRVL